MSLSKFCLGSLMAVAACASQATVIPVASVTGSGSYSGALSVLTDGVIPAQGTDWTSPNTVHWSDGEGVTGTVFTFAFSQLYTLKDVTLSVDNNDNYRVQSSVDGVTWTTLFRVVSGDGTVGGGLDTFSSATVSAYYNEDIDFAPTVTKYLRVYATGGDHSYAIGEVKMEGAAVVPEPEALSLAAAGLGVVGLSARRKKSG